MQSQAMVWGVVLSALLGMFGQGIRVIAGLKKKSDESAEKNEKLSETFDKTRFILSLFIGAITGIAAFLGYWFGGASEGADPTKSNILFGIIATGYSGTDFIEAFAKKYLPSASSPPSKQ